MSIDYNFDTIWRNSIYTKLCTILGSPRIYICSRFIKIEGYYTTNLKIQKCNDPFIILISKLSNTYIYCI